MLNPQIAQLALELRQLRSTAAILRFRRRLDSGTAQAVIRAVPLLERAAIVLAVQFSSAGRWDAFDSAVIETTSAEAEAIWNASDQPPPSPIPSQHRLAAPPASAPHGRAPHRSPRRTTASGTRRTPAAQ